MVGMMNAVAAAHQTHSTCKHWTRDGSSRVTCTTYTVIGEAAGGPASVVDGGSGVEGGDPHRDCGEQRQDPAQEDALLDHGSTLVSVVCWIFDGH